MANVQTGTAWVWEHIENVILAPGVITVLCFERLVLFPEPLPLLFNLVEIVAACLFTQLFTAPFSTT
jgi:hypothetical protein